jgi:hypothetical protein
MTTVGELINELSNYDDDLEVVIENCYDFLFTVNDESNELIIELGE